MKNNTILLIAGGVAAYFLLWKPNIAGIGAGTGNGIFRLSDLIDSIGDIPNGGFDYPDIIPYGDDAIITIPLPPESPYTPDIPITETGGTGTKTGGGIGGYEG